MTKIKKKWSSNSSHDAYFNTVFEIENSYIAGTPLPPDASAFPFGGKLEPHSGNTVFTSLSLLPQEQEGPCDCPQGRRGLSWLKKGGDRLKFVIQAVIL